MILQTALRMKTAGAAFLVTGRAMRRSLFVRMYEPTEPTS